MRLIDADELKKVFDETVCIEPLPYAFVKQIIDNAPTVELTASFMRQQAEDELIRIRAEANQRGYQRGYNWGLEIGQNLKRPTGKWINHYDDLFPAESTEECSLCHQEQYIGNDDNFCPNCGARMKGGAE